jgi:hypothetical protein
MELPNNIDDLTPDEQTTYHSMLNSFITRDLHSYNSEQAINNAEHMLRMHRDFIRETLMQGNNPGLTSRFRVLYLAIGEQLRLFAERKTQLMTNPSVGGRRRRHRKGRKSHKRRSSCKRRTRRV